MVETLTSYRATDGAIFPNAWEAWKHELFCWLRTHGIDNDAIANKVIKSLDDGRPASIEALATIVGGLDRWQPAPPIRALADAEPVEG